VRWLLANSDDTVTIFDKLTYAGNLESINDLIDDKRCKFVQGDICDADEVLAAMKGHQGVVHFAAESHVDRSIIDPYAFVRTNAYGTNVMCDVARQVEVQRFLHISTDEVYGSIDEGSFSETDILCPRSPYSASKASSDLIALSYVTTHGLPVVVTRCSNNFGPYQFPEKLIPLFTTNLLDGKKVPLYGDGGNVRDWIHVEDHNIAAHLVLQKGEVGQVYNIGAHNEITNREIPIACLNCVAVMKVQSRQLPIGLDTTVVTRCTSTRFRRSAGSSVAHSKTRLPKQLSGIAATVLGGNHSKPALVCD
jgi:dTDP-glucose 4,6-dehydratase